METKFSALKKEVQEIIDYMAHNQNEEANAKLMIASELLDEILDHSDDDADLIEISHFQVLLNQLQQKLKDRNQ